MAQTIPLKLVIDLGGGSEFFDSVADSDQDIVYPWPGDPVTFDLTVEPHLIQPVWIGVSADGNDAQAYPVTTSVEDILAAGWAHVYQGTEIADGSGNVTVYSDQYNHILLAIAACCNNNFPTQALALKQSRFPLTPGETYPCGSEAIFTWLVVYGRNEDRPALSARFDIKLTSADQSIILEGPFSSFGIPPGGKITKSWPNDFIGMTVGGENLVANDVEPMVGERRVMDFDNGTIEVKTSVLDETFEVIIQEANTWALPGTQCGANCIDPYPDPITFPDATEGVAYSAFTQLEGDGPFALEIVQKPSWLTASLNAVTGLITWGGTPPTFGNDQIVEFKAENCGEPIVAETPSSGEILLDVKQALLFQARTSISNQPWYKVCWSEFLGLFIAVSQQDGSGTQAATSPDGLVWTLRSTPGNINWNDVISFEDLGRVVAVGTGDTGAMMWSDDGITWTAADVDLGQWRGVSASPSLAELVAVGSLGSNRVVFSSNAVAWDLGNAAVLNQWYSVAWSPTLNLFAAVSITGSGNQVMTSIDGENWTSRTSPAGTRMWFKIIWAGGQFVAVGASGSGGSRVMTSPDGIIWTIRNAANVNGAWLGLAYGNNIYVAVANTSAGAEKQMMKSGDAITWQEVNGPNQAWTSVAYNGVSRFVAVGTNQLMTAEWT
jgi:hypothetical protein